MMNRYLIDLRKLGRMIKKTISGHFVKLIEINENDFTKIIEWRNNPEYNKFLNQTFTLTMDLQKKWYRNYLLDDTQITYGIHVKNNLIGTLGATDINLTDGEFIPGRLLVDFNYRFGPYIIDAFISLYDYFFNELNFKKAYLYVVENNRGAISTNKQFGFKKSEEFIKEEFKTIGGHQMIEMVCLKSDYLHKRPKNIGILSKFKK